MAINDSHNTTQVKSIISRSFGRSPAKDSVLDRAISLLTSDDYKDSHVALLKANLLQVEKELKTNKGSEELNQKQRMLEGEIKSLDSHKQDDRNSRKNHIENICQEIIALTEAENFAETNRKSAQFLGTLQLLTPDEESKVAESNEQSKPIYKAILALRLLDYLCINNLVQDPYIKKYLTDIKPEQFSEFSVIDPPGCQLFIDNVKIPLIMAAMLQDIGNYHPSSQDILRGPDGQQDPTRTLPIEERKQLLQINYRETIKYLVDGIGISRYVGNSREERDLFDLREKEKLVFIKQLLKGSVNPKEGLGNLLKVPQIYSSIIMSTKNNYNYKLLPKVYQVLNQNAERGSCSQRIVDALYRITGVFPQGYGITYIPTESDGGPGDSYEYAIVTHLYPENPQWPMCRIATRKLTFIGYGHDIEIHEDRNLYFAQTAKKMARISKDRLNEILELLSSNYLERQNLDLLPRCWQTKEFFSEKNNQKLWNKISS